jgi:hypothetical protein
MNVKGDIPGQNDRERRAYFDFRGKVNNCGEAAGVANGAIIIRAVRQLKFFAVGAGLFSKVGVEGERRRQPLNGLNFHRGMN